MTWLYELWSHRPTAPVRTAAVSSSSRFLAAGRAGASSRRPARRRTTSRTIRPTYSGRELGGVGGERGVVGWWCPLGVGSSWLLGGGLAAAVVGVVVLGAGVGGRWLAVVSVGRWFAFGLLWTTRNHSAPDHLDELTAPCRGCVPAVSRPCRRPLPLDRVLRLREARGLRGHADRHRHGPGHLLR